MEKNNISQIETTKNVKSFGFLPDGKEVMHYTLTNKKGLEFSVINYGATITSLKIPITENEKVDVVLGFDALEDYIGSYYLPNPPYFGTIVGRFAGRINNAEFRLNEKMNFLNKNHGEHNIHGGILGFGRKLWRVTKITTGENPSITLEYISPNNEENFPGELIAQAIYTITEENELKVSFRAKSDEDTIVNLTQHSYFNLDGHSNDIINQQLFINADKVLETNEELIPTGDFASLKNHDFDFTSIKSCPKSIDTTFVLEKSTNESELTKQIAAMLYSEMNKLKMSVTTNQPAVHVYVGGNCFNRIKGKNNTDYHTKSGICFETQNFPDAPNHSHFPNSILKKGEEYLHETTFKFENL